VWSLHSKHVGAATGVTDVMKREDAATMAALSSTSTADFEKMTHMDVGL
jgi:hypothetical protein